MRLTAILLIPILFLIFWLSAAWSGFVAIATVLFDGGRRLSKITHANDRCLAAILFGDDSETVSSRCGSSNCRFCRALCRFLHLFLERDHCAKAANKGPYA